MKLTSYARREIGSSSIPNLVLTDQGYIGFSSPNDELEKAINALQGQEATNDIANLPKVKAGTILEPAIIQMFHNELKLICAEQGKLPLNISVPDKAYFYEVDGGKIGSSLDAEMRLDTTLNLIDHSKSSHSLNGKGVIEIKNYSGAASDDVSEIYKLQVQAQLLTTGYNYAILVRLVKGWELQWFVYKPNKEIQDKLINAAVEFWHRVDGIMQGDKLHYAAANTKEASRIFKGNGSKDVINFNKNNELPQLIDDYLSADKAIKASKKIQDTVSIRMKEILGEHEKAECQGYMINHSTYERAKTKTIKVEGAAPTVTRRFTIKDMNG